MTLNLGSVKADDASCSKDIKCRIGMAKKKRTQLNNIWEDRGIPIELKLKLRKCLVYMNGCESLAQKKDGDTNSQSAEIGIFIIQMKVS